MKFFRKFMKYSNNYYKCFVNLLWKLLSGKMCRWKEQTLNGTRSRTGALESSELIFAQFRLTSLFCRTIRGECGDVHTLHTWRCGSNMPLWSGERSVIRARKSICHFYDCTVKFDRRKWGGSARAYSSSYPSPACVVTSSLWTPTPRNVSSIKSNSAPKWVSFLLRFVASIRDLSIFRRRRVSESDLI